MPRKVAQMHMDDHIVEDRSLLAALNKWDELHEVSKEKGDAYREQDKKVKEKVLDLTIPKGAKRVRCGEFLLKIRDVKAADVKTRRRARRSVKIEKMA